MDAEQYGDWEQRASVHAALADVTRLRIVDTLSVGDASPSELGATLGVSSNLLAHHLKVLDRTGIISRHRSEGDARRWYLSLNWDRAGIAIADTPETGPGQQVRRVLFVCTANTARSHLAAAMWRRASRIRVASAGTQPGPALNPRASAAAARHGLDLTGRRPRALVDTYRDGDIVVTVCDRAHEEIDIAWAHWSIPDPVPSDSDAAFETAYQMLVPRIAALAHRLTPTSAKEGSLPSV